MAKGNVLKEILKEIFEGFHMWSPYFYTRLLLKKSGSKYSIQIIKTSKMCYFCI